MNKIYLPQEIKRIRLQKLQQTKNKCELCKGKGKKIFYIDGNENNHELKNMKLVCYNCYQILNTGRINQSYGKYGTRLKIIARATECSITTIWKYFQGDKLKDTTKKKIENYLNKKKTNKLPVKSI